MMWIFAWYGHINISHGAVWAFKANHMSLISIDFIGDEDYLTSFKKFTAFGHKTHFSDNMYVTNLTSRIETIW